METMRPGVQPGDRHESGDAGQPVRQGPKLYRLARGVVARIRQAKVFVAGFLIGLSVWTPVFVATAAEETEWQQYGLPGGLAMFGAGVWLRMGGPLRRRQETPPRDPAGPSRPGMDRLAV